MKLKYTKRTVLSASTLALFAALALGLSLGTNVVPRARAAAELPTLALSSPIAGFSQPLSITNAGDGSNRQFVVEQGGRIRIVKNGAILSTPFLDISARISTGGERGLLGLAFPPDFRSKRYFYVNYTDTAGNTVIARYRVSANPDVADPSSEQILLNVAQPYSNHNGGQLAFSPRDGYLYIGLGDGGSGGDPENRAQNTGELLGKVLRIDTETGSPATYNVPASNPFVNRAGYRPEIWALGLRNPWRFSFDRQMGDLYVADVGQGSWEEVNFQDAANPGGENYGWRILEGTHCFNPAGGSCSDPNLKRPVAEYDHSLGCSVTGGFVYRGSTYPRMNGLYFYGDFCSGRIWGLRQEGGVWQNTMLLDTTLGISTFGEDEVGNLYVANLNDGTIYTLIDTTPTTAASSVQLSSARYTVVEGMTAVPVTVTRTGSSAGTVTVGYELSDNTARQKSDYTLASGRLTFAPGETSKSFDVLVNEDSYAETTESLRITLNTPTGGATLGSVSTALLEITDNGDTGTGANPIDDTNIFVGQHYHDFLGRQADPDGQAFWAQQIAACGTNAACIDDRRQNVSAAFFLSIEFQSTGYLVYRFEKASFNRLVRYEPFLRDVRRIGEGVIVGVGDWEARLEANRQAFAQEWVARADFRALYDSKNNAEYVDALFANSEVTPTGSERNALIDGLNASTETRASVLLKVSENGAVYNKQYNPAFVLMQYFGYLRRNPDDAPDNNLVGYNFWLNKLNEFTQQGEDVRQEHIALARAKRAQMVRSFLVSGEYRERFGRP